MEFWFLLHFVHTDKFYRDYGSLLRDLQKHLGDYEKTERYFVKTKPDIYLRLLSKLQEAKNNADKCGRFDFENIRKGLSEMQIIFRELGL
ncbi:MAG: RloB domain-containing protein [Prevotellaceae bacterium]|nr:RloB domain-containing protein [Prevotellaceae bacterium]